MDGEAAQSQSSSGLWFNSRSLVHESFLPAVVLFIDFTRTTEENPNSISCLISQSTAADLQWRCEVWYYSSPASCFV